MNNNARIIAEVSDYQALVQAFRARCNELGSSMERLDALAGLPDRYLSKLLAPVPIKGIGPISLGPLLGALGLKLIIAEDAEALARIKSRLVPRVNASGRMLPNGRRKKSSLVGNSEWARVMNARRTLLVTANKRKEIARHAATIRWRQVKDAVRASRVSGPRKWIRWDVPP